MTLKHRIDRLEDAHRGLHARHEALTVMCQMLFPLVKASPALKQQITTRAYDVLNELMDQHRFDDLMQEDVRRAMDQLTHSILSVD